MAAAGQLSEAGRPDWRERPAQAKLAGLPIEKALEAEVAGHPGYEEHEPAASAAGNTRNGHSHKILQDRFGELSIGILRDRSGTFEPELAPKPPRRTGFDDKTLSLSARDTTVRVKAVYLVIGITAPGKKEVLGLGLTRTEDAKFWL